LLGADDQRMQILRPQCQKSILTFGHLKINSNNKNCSWFSV